MGVQWSVSSPVELFVAADRVVAQQGVHEASAWMDYLRINTAQGLHKEVLHKEVTAAARWREFLCVLMCSYVQ